MEFWGVEVKAGESLKVTPEIGKLIHISQASLGEVTDVKAAKYVPLRLKIDNKNFVVGSLSAGERTQLMFDLVFEREFEISHGGKTSVFFLGYSADEPTSDDEEFSSDDFDSEDEAVDVNENGTLRPTLADVKAIKAGMAKAGTEKEELSDDEDDNESDSDADMALDGEPLDDDSEDDEDDSGDEEELPKAQPSKKRPAEAKQATPASKKAKSATPDKSGKKGKTPTPVPTKSAGKDKLKDQTPKSASQETCKSCSKTFTSPYALMAHSKAKHGDK